MKKLTMEQTKLEHERFQTRLKEIDNEKLTIQQQLDEINFWKEEYAKQREINIRLTNENIGR